jgi:hypothetical protein
MSWWFELASVGLASIGWRSPTREDLVAILRRCHGLFEQSNSERAWAFVGVAFYFSLFGLCFGLIFRASGNSAGADTPDWPLLFPALLLGAYGCYLLGGWGVSYRFDEGYITAHGRDGTMRWRESLTDLSRVNIRSGGHMTCLLCVFAKRRRVILLFHALSVASSIRRP